MTAKKNSKTPVVKKAAENAESGTGTYVYDKELKKVVKVSSDIPGLSRGKSSSGPCCGGNCRHGGGCPLE